MNRYHLLRGVSVALLLASGSAVAICNGTNVNTAAIASTPTINFLDHGDGTVTHLTSGLMWKRCSQTQAWNGETCTGEAEGFTWGAALAVVQGDSFAGYEDWRLPNVQELTSIIEMQCWEPAVNTMIFPETPSQRFWSSSPSVRDEGANAWSVPFSDGAASTEPKTGARMVRLVRTPD